MRLAQNISFEAPARILKKRAHLNSKQRLATTTIIRRRLGLTLNILKISRKTTSKNTDKRINNKKNNFFMV
jgi:hypothetical protein